MTKNVEIKKFSNGRYFPESDIETPTGRCLYTGRQIRSAYSLAVEDCIAEAVKWGKSGGDYSLLEKLQELKS